MCIYTVSYNLQHVHAISHLPNTAATTQESWDRMATLIKSSFRYQKCYCEENSLLLCQQLISDSRADPDQLFIVFISNPLKQVPIWYQGADSNEDGLVIWDYHVLVIQAATTAANCSLVWDLDTRLPFPCPQSTYMQCALGGQLQPQFQRLYRLVPYRLAQQHFGSDRSHMVKPDGTWSAPPPPWPCLQPFQPAVPTTTAALAASSPAAGGGPDDQLEAGQHTPSTLVHTLSTYITLEAPTITPQQLQQLRGSRGVALTVEGLEALWGCHGQVVAEEGLEELFGGAAVEEEEEEEEGLVPGR